MFLLGQISTPTAFRTIVQGCERTRIFTPFAQSSFAVLSEQVLAF